MIGSYFFWYNTWASYDALYVKMSLRIWYELFMNEQSLNDIGVDTSMSKNKKCHLKSLNPFFGADVSTLDANRTLFVHKGFVPNPRH